MSALRELKMAIDPESDRREETPALAPSDGGIPDGAPSDEAALGGEKIEKKSEPRAAAMKGTLPATVNGEAVKLDLLTLVERASEMRTSEDGWAQHLGGERWLEGVGETPDGQRVTVKAVGDFDLLTDIGAAVSGVHARRRARRSRTGRRTNRKSRWSRSNLRPTFRRCGARLRTR